jgi:hypothetical protein
MRRRTKTLLISSVVIVVGTVSSAAASPGAVTSIDVTFSGTGTGKMTLAVNHQDWTKNLHWDLTWKILPGTPNLQSASETASGSSSYYLDKGFPAKHVKFCKGGVKASGAHAILGAYSFPSAGLTAPKASGVTVGGFPTHAQQHAFSSWGEVEVPIFGSVADACFGPSIMAVSGGTNQEEDVGMIYAIFPFSLKHPASGDYTLHRSWVYNSPESTDDYSWDGTFTVVVHRAH